MNKELPAPLATIEKIADYVVKSRLFGVKSKEEAVALMLLAQAEGLHPMMAIREYYIVHGRPALRADAMLARFQKAGGKVTWHELSDTRAKATFYHPQGGKVTIEWDIERAKKAGLVKEDSAWLKYPRSMLRARVISEGVRTVFPAVVTGVYTPEELQDMTEEEVTVVEAAHEEAHEEHMVGEEAIPETKAEADVVAGAIEWKESEELLEEKKEKVASEKQTNYIRQLMQSKGITEFKEIAYKVLEVEKEIDELTSSEASKIIDFLKGMKKAGLSESQKSVLRNRLMGLQLSPDDVERLVNSISYDDFIVLSKAIQRKDDIEIASILKKYDVSYTLDEDFFDDIPF